MAMASKDLLIVGPGETQPLPVAATPPMPTPAQHLLPCPLLRPEVLVPSTPQAAPQPSRLCTQARPTVLSPPCVPHPLAGKLGGYLGKLWLEANPGCKVVGQTKSDTNHERWGSPQCSRPPASRLRRRAGHSQRPRCAPPCLPPSAGSVPWAWSRPSSPQRRARPPSSPTCCSRRRRAASAPSTCRT